MCTDLEGEPWAAREDARGWAVIGRRFPHDDAALLMTEDPSARVGWYAVTALDATMTSVLVEGSGSMLSLSAGGHLVVVDRERHVAGEVIAATHALFGSMTRTGWGIVVARDVDASTREVVVGTDLQRPFAREQRGRPAGASTARVFALQHGELLALTNRGVEWSAGPGHAFIEVVRHPASWSAGDPGSHGSFGWLDDGTPALVFPDGWARTNCTPGSDSDQ
jgi:hypothetical protein